MNPKILVASPTFRGMAYCFNKFIVSIKSLDYDNFDILIVDNTEEDGFFEELEKIKDIIKIKFNPLEKNRKIRIIESRNKIIDYARTNNYDYILMMDSDVIPPVDILKKLISADKDLVSGLYYNYFKISGGLKWVPVCWKLLTEDEFSEFKSKVNIPESLTREDCPRYLTEKEVNSKELMEVFHPSAGCLLISKTVFSKLNYPILMKTSDVLYGDDVGFIKQSRANNFRVWCNASLLCEHLVEGKFNKDDKGNLIHPISLEGD